MRNVSEDEASQRFGVAYSAENGGLNMTPSSVPKRTNPGCESTQALGISRLLATVEAL
jgi:hypothetical protein